LNSTYNKQKKKEMQSNFPTSQTPQEAPPLE